MTRGSSANVRGLLGSLSIAAGVLVFTAVGLVQASGVEDTPVGKLAGVKVDNWVQVQASAAYSLRDVVAIDGQNAIAVGGSNTGAGGVIQRLSNAGGTQVTQHVGPSNTDLRGITRLGAMEYCVVGGKASGDPAVFHSGDGGSNWTDVSPLLGVSHLLAVASAVDGSALAVGLNGAILRSPANCQNWVAETSGTTQYLFSVAIEGSEAWAVGNGATILRRGAVGIWSPQAAPQFPVATGDLFGVAAGQGNKVWAVGRDGVILKSVDGVNWTTKAVIETAFLLGVTMFDANTGWAVGSDGTILKTNNTGNNWTQQNSPVELGTHLHAVSAASGTIAWAVGDSGTVLRTS